VLGGRRAQGLSRSAVALRFGPRSFVSRPRLDSFEHGGTLALVGMTRPSGVRCRGTKHSRRNLVFGGSQGPEPWCTHAHRRRSSEAVDPFL